MNFDPVAVPLEEHELDELQNLLTQQSHEANLSLDGVHGLLTAVIVGPEEIDLQEWLMLILNPAHIDSDHEASRLFLLLKRLYFSTSRDIEAMIYEPILSEVETENDDFAFTARGWCEGFSMGVDLREPIWAQRMQKDPRLMEILHPIISLAADEGLFEDETGDEPAPLSEAEYETSLDALTSAVLDTQQYWHDYPAGGVDTIQPPVPAGAPRRRAGKWLH